MKFNFSNLTNSVSRAFHEAGFQLKKHSPEILVVAGVAGTVVSAVMACKATTKVNFVLEETKAHVDIIHEGVKNGEVQGYTETGEVGAVPYTQEDSKKDLAIVYARTGLKLAKLYAPAIILGAASITAILAGHNITRKRSLALAAAYTAVDNGFKQYRGRVVERLGEKFDKELLYNIKAQEVEEIVVDENGEETVVKNVVEVADPSAVITSPYTFCFDKKSSAFQDNHDSNKFFILRQQDYANERLKSKKRLFLNEVLEMLGLPRCRMGQTVGWVYDEQSPVGDNFIDFGISDIRNESSRDFMNGTSQYVWLNFNVDGDILYSL